MSTLDNPADAILAGLERAKTLLSTGVIEDVVRGKRQAEAVLAYVRGVRLSDSDAVEMLRRAERALGLAIRRGQQAGEIETRHDATLRATQSREDRRTGAVTVVTKTRPMDYLTRSERSHSNGDVFDLTDGVTDRCFEEALAAARAEGNLSRANVVRKVKGEPPKRRPEHLRGLRHLDGNRIVEQTILDSGIERELAEQIDYRALDRDRLEEWISSLSSVIKSLTTLRRNLNKELSHGQG